LEEKIMRKHVCESLLALSFLVSMLAASAPASAKTIAMLRAQVPFDFYVGDRLIAAGDCAVASITDGGSALRISSSGGKESAISLTDQTSAKANREGNPRLVFHKYGDQYFLAAVWDTGQGGRALHESKRERNLRKEMRVAQQAGAAMEVVTIEAR
jgi:hypothetical protein